MELHHEEGGQAAGAEEGTGSVDSSGRSGAGVIVTITNLINVATAGGEQPGAPADGSAADSVASAPPSQSSTDLTSASSSPSPSEPTIVNPEPVEGALSTNSSTGQPETAEGSGDAQPGAAEDAAAGGVGVGAAFSSADVDPNERLFHYCCQLIEKNPHAAVTIPAVGSRKSVKKERSTSALPQRKRGNGHSVNAAAAPQPGDGSAASDADVLQVHGGMGVNGGQAGGEAAGGVKVEVDGGGVDDVRGEGGVKRECDAVIIFPGEVVHPDELPSFFPFNQPTSATPSAAASPLPLHRSKKSKRKSSDPSTSSSLTPSPSPSPSPSPPPKKPKKKRATASAALDVAQATDLSLLSLTGHHPNSSSNPSTSSCSSPFPSPPSLRLPTSGAPSPPSSPTCPPSPTCRP